jgi:hypothetical protein
MALQVETSQMVQLHYVREINHGARMSDEDLRVDLESLRAENDKLNSKGARGLGLKVSAKGAASQYGVGRFPVTFYEK